MNKSKKSAFVPAIAPKKPDIPFSKWPLSKIKKPIPFAEKPKTVTNYVDVPPRDVSVFAELRRELTQGLVKTIVETLVREVKDHIRDRKDIEGDDKMPRAKDIRPDGDGSSRSSYTKMRKMPENLKPVHENNAKLVQKYISPYKISTPTGKQDVGCYGVNDSAQLNMVFNRVMQPNTGSLNIVFFHTHSWLCFTNQSKTTTFVDIYEMTCRDSTSEVNPVVIWEKGLAENERVSMEVEGDQSHHQTYRSTPFLSPPFCETYNIDKIFKVELPQGRSHIHESTYFLNNIQRSDRVSATGSGAIRDVAHYLLMIVYGSPVMEVKGGPTTSSSCDLSIIHDITMHYAIPDDKTKRYYVKNSVQTSVGEKFINPGSGQVDVDGK